MDSLASSHALLLFSKLPRPGWVKTRLTPLKDGVFSPETASQLYHRMLFDVVEICCWALDKLEERGLGRFELVISTAPEEDARAMERLFADAGAWPRPLHFIADVGSTFDEHYNDAFRQVWKAGAASIFSMGADMPALRPNDVIGGFQALADLHAAERPGIVLSPDQEMGVSLIGWNRETDFSHDGVFYNSSGLTVLPAYIAKAREADLPVVYLPPVPDVDTMGDLFHNATLVEAICYAAKFSGEPAPYRTAEMLQYLGLDDIRVAPNDLHDPRPI